MLFDVSQNELIEKTAVELKKLINQPSWASFVKTGTHKQRPPVRDDWWFVRAAAVLRKVYLTGPVGVSKLRTKYGGKKNLGVRPEKFYKGSGSVIRKVFQELEAAGLVKQDVRGKHKGRIITPKGKSVLFTAAKSLGGNTKAPIKKVEVIPKNKEAEVPKETETVLNKDTPKVEENNEAVKKEAVPKEKAPKNKKEDK
jgi:small subunit ribosomal protein S19e